MRDYVSSGITPLEPGKEIRVLDIEDTGSNSREARFSLGNCSLLVFSLFVETLGENGTLAVDIYSVGEFGQEVKLASYPVQRTASTELTFLTVGTPAAARLKVVATNTGDSCTYSLRVRGLSSSGNGTGDESAEELDITNDTLRRMELLLCHVDSTLTKILNHQRVITQLEEDEAEEF